MVQCECQINTKVLWVDQVAQIPKKRHLKAAVDPSPKPGLSDLKQRLSALDYSTTSCLVHQMKGGKKGWDEIVMKEYGWCYALEKDCLLGIRAYWNPKRHCYTLS